MENSTEKVAFEPSQSSDRKTPNVFKSKDGRTLVFYSAKEARLINSNWTATLLTRNVDLQGLVPHTSAIDLQGLWASGSSVVDIQKSAQGDFTIDGKLMAVYDTNVYQSDARVWVATDEQTLHDLHVDRSLSNESRTWTRISRPALERNLVPLGLIDDPAVSPQGAWEVVPPNVVIAPRNPLPPTLWNFESTVLGLYDGSQHLFRVNDSQNIYRDANYWYVFVDNDLMFHDRDGQLTIFKRHSTSNPLLGWIAGAGGFACQLGAQPVRSNRQMERQKSFDWRAHGLSMGDFKRAD